MASELRVNTINSRTGFGTITVSETGQDLVGITTIENLTTENTLVGAAASFTGNVQVGGVLTYEDVTNIDSVGLITARQGIEIGARPGVAASISVDGNMIVSGISTFKDNVYIADKILHDGDGDTAIRFPSANTFAVETAGSERLRVSDAGVLGIKVTPESWHGDKKAIQVGGAALSGTTPGDGQECNLTNNAYYDSTDNRWEFIADDDASGIFMSNGTISFKRSPSSGTADAALSWATSATLSDTGKLLLGTTTVGHASADDLTIATSANTGITIRSGTSSQGSLYFSDATSGGGEYAGWMRYDHSGNDLTIGTAETERVRIDSSGRVGIQGAATKALLDVRASGGSATLLTAVFGADEGQSVGALTDSTDKGARVGLYHYDTDEEPYALFSSGGTTSANSIYFGGGTSLMNAATDISFYTAANTTTVTGNQRLLIQSDGKLRTQSAGYIFTASSAGSLSMYGGNTNLGGGIVLTGGNGSGEISFYAQQSTSTPAERVRIGNNGRLSVGTASELGTAHAGMFQVINTSSTDMTNDCLSFFETAASDWCIKTNYNTSGTHYHMAFEEEGTTRGTISGSDGANVAFTPGSDYRMKENVVDLTATEGINYCKNLKPRKYNWIDNRKSTGKINTVNGFIAHEVEEAGIGHLVHGNGKDAVNEDGSIDPQTLDYAGMTPVLSAAIKGLIDKVETLEAKVAALESK